jgi:hypothetical protein
VQHQVILDKIPPHRSQMRQPFDQGLFGRLKIQYRVFAPVKCQGHWSGLDWLSRE